MHISTIAIVGALASNALAAPAPQPHVLHERRNVDSNTWIKSEKLESDTLLPVRIGLTQSNLDKGYDLLMEVSQAHSAKYGQHYTADEVTELFAPAQSTVDSVRSWLAENGFSRAKLSANKQWLQFDATTKDLESLLNAKYHIFEETNSGKTSIACDEYHVPAHIQEHVDYITPGVKHLATRSKRSSHAGATKRNGVGMPQLIQALPKSMDSILASPLDNCDVAITPACVMALYNITAPTLSDSCNSMGIYEWGDTYAQENLDLFFQNVATNIPTGTSPTLNAVDGATAPVDISDPKDGGESDLDLQLAYPIIYPQTITLFQTDDDLYTNRKGFSGVGIFNTFLDAIDGSYCTYSAFNETGNDPNVDPNYPDTQDGGFTGQLECGVYTPTNVISISYGGQESDLPINYQQRQCNEFMKLGLQGVSIFVASGDSGVGGRSGCLGSDGSIFSPDYPANCPYITTLGATFLNSGADVSFDAEVAVSRFPSGGGFSNLYPIPSYQADAVANFLTNHTPTYESYSTTGGTVPEGQGVYNSNGRGYPDFSAVGDNVVVYKGGKATTIGGTSASTPVFAAIINRINEERIAAGKSTVGFVNPTLYAHPEVLHDITEGSNPACGSDGFSVAPGWDPVTGLGTPNYPAMLELFMSLP